MTPIETPTPTPALAPVVSPPVVDEDEAVEVLVVVEVALGMDSVTLAVALNVVVIAVVDKKAGSVDCLFETR